MEVKGVKATLKSIKENLDAKDFKTAISQCKSVLKMDRNNYIALVFFGVALQECDMRDEAPKAFKKAIEIKPENNLAWRGLVSYYERFGNSETNDELLNAYARLIILETEHNKYGEYISRYENLAIANQDCHFSKTLYAALEDLCDDKKVKLQQCLLNVFFSCSNEDDEIYEYKKKLMKECIGIKPSLTLCKKYLELLLKDHAFDELTVVGNQYQIYYPNDTDVLEYICKAYVQLFSQYDHKINDVTSFKSAYEALLSIAPNSYLGYLCHGIYELQKGELVTAVDLLKQSVNENSTFGFSWFLLCKCQILLYHYLDSEASAKEVIKCFKDDVNNQKNCERTKLWLVQSLCEQEIEEKWNEAVNLGCEFLETNSTDHKDILPYIIKALIKLNRISECEKYLNILKEDEKHFATNNYLQSLILKQNATMTECKAHLECLVKEYPEFFDAWLELGKIYFTERDGTLSLMCLLKAAKLNQWCYLGFLYLGHCYKELLNDLDKARRCYQKAFQLSPLYSDTGLYLSDVYRLLGREDLNGQLLSLVTNQMPKLKSGWLKMGIHYLSTKQYQNAVSSLRVAIRLDPYCRLAWELQADVYFSQGAYISAEKAYKQAIDLGSNSVYPLLQIAHIKHLTGQYEVSISCFKEIIEKYPKYLPALKGLAEVCISQMRALLNQSLNGLAMDKCQLAVTTLIECIEIRQDIACIWKLLGDACVLMSNLPERFCKLIVSPKLVTEPVIPEDQKECVLERIGILKLGLRCYYETLALDKNSSTFWFDLASCYNSLAQCESTPENKKEMRQLACSAVKKSISINKTNWESWNLFGIISASNEIKNFPLAQHCFIRSLEENDNSAMVWTNLGTLYLCLQDLKLANQCFTEAQRIDHDYVQCWIGQAIIAQTTGHHDAMDLFRHSNHLGIHPEGSLGYANLVCQTLLNTTNKNDKNYIYSIKNMNAVVVACDALTWYTDKITDNSCAYNMLGILLERQQLYQQSCKAYHNAVSLLLSSIACKSDSEDMLSALDKALLNYGRSLAILGKADEAIGILKQIRKANFTNQCALAEAYFKARKYEEAYSSYETTLEWLAPDSGFKSHILVAMAAVVYLHQGKDDAKILLMQASQLKPSSVQGLFACCALGMLHSDLSLSELSLKELSQFRDDPKYLNHIAIFESYLYLFKGEKNKAIRVFTKAIHRHPDQPSLWLSLSLLLLHLYPSFDSQIAARCAEITVNTGRSTIDITKVMSLVSLSNLLSGQGAKSLRSSQKAVHLFPHQTENWVVLVASVLSRCLSKSSSKDILWLQKTISYIRRKLEATKAMSQWLSNNERKVLIMAQTLKDEK